jgi:hypothetical protein
MELLNKHRRTLLCNFELYISFMIIINCYAVHMSMFGTVFDYTTWMN